MQLLSHQFSLASPPMSIYGPTLLHCITVHHCFLPTTVCNQPLGTSPAGGLAVRIFHANLARLRCRRFRAGRMEAPWPAQSLQHVRARPFGTSTSRAPHRHAMAGGGWQWRRSCARAPRTSSSSSKSPCRRRRARRHSSRRYLPSDKPVGTCQMAKSFAFLVENDAWTADVVLVC